MNIITAIQIEVLEAKLEDSSQKILLFEDEHDQMVKENTLRNDQLLRYVGFSWICLQGLLRAFCSVPLCFVTP